MPGRTQGLGLITEPLLKDLQINRVDYATINLVATLLGALACLPIGRWIDGFGSRIVLTATALALGLTVVSMSATTGFAALCIAITLTRALGQSALSVISLALVGKWFSSKLNMAMGIFSVLVGFGFIAAFSAVGPAVLNFGWRTAWAGIGWTILLVLVPLSWMFARNKPEEQGLSLDGLATAAPQGPDFTLPEALGSPAFWLFALSSATFALAYSGISLFNESILIQLGFNAETYHRVLIISTMLGLAANFACGWLATKWPIQRVMGIGMAVLAASLAWLPMVRTELDVTIYGIGMGVAGGVVTVVFFSVWGQVFGRAHLGRIQGIAQMMTVLASAIGPLLLAETLRISGSYNSMFQTLAVAVTLLGLGCWSVPLPEPRVRYTHA